jgi:hypothetical protein
VEWLVYQKDRWENDDGQPLLMDIIEKEKNPDLFNGNYTNTPSNINYNEIMEM